MRPIDLAYYAVAALPWGLMLAPKAVGPLVRAPIDWTSRAVGASAAVDGGLALAYLSLITYAAFRAAGGGWLGAFLALPTAALAAWTGLFVLSDATDGMPETAAHATLAAVLGGLTYAAWHYQEDKWLAGAMAALPAYLALIQVAFVAGLRGREADGEQSLYSIGRIPVGLPIQPDGTPFRPARYDRAGQWQPYGGPGAKKGSLIGYLAETVADLSGVRNYRDPRALTPLQKEIAEAHERTMREYRETGKRPWWKPRVSP